MSTSDEQGVRFIGHFGRLRYEQSLPGDAIRVLSSGIWIESGRFKGTVVLPDTTVGYSRWILRWYWSFDFLPVADRGRTWHFMPIGGKKLLATLVAKGWKVEEV